MFLPFYFFKPGTNKESLETKGPYPLVKLFVNVNFFFLNKQKPLIRRERSFQIVLVWFNLQLAITFSVTPGEQNAECFCEMCCRKAAALLWSGSDAMNVPDALRTPRALQLHVYEQSYSY